MKLTKWLAPALALVLLVGCGSKAETPAVDNENETVTNQGYTLTIPAEYKDLLTVETPEENDRGTVFAVAETASLDAAKALGWEDDGAGSLVTIRRITKGEAVDNVVYDIPGERVFAKDDAGYYFVADYPTDVRLVREDNDAMNAAMDQWSAMNAWADTVPDTFLADNSGLTACTAEELLADAGDLISDADHYASLTNMDARDVDSFAKMVKEFYLDEDWEAMSQVVEYPITLYPDYVAHDPAEFLQYMEGKHMSDSDRQALTDESCHNMFVNGEGICMGSGQLWLRDSGFDAATGQGEPNLAVIAVSGLE